MGDPICAPSTPLLPSALAVVRISGEALGPRLSGWFPLPPPRRATLCALSWGGFRERVLVLHFPAPRSYTGEDVVELQVPGNPLLVRRLLDHLGSLGIRLAEPGEFTRRALLNGKQDLLQAEALRDLIQAATEAQVLQAEAAAGGLPAWLREARETLGPWVAAAEAAVDYGEEEGLSLDPGDLGGFLAGLEQTFHVEQQRAEAARWLRDGIIVVLAGRPNAGKSTLFNTLLGRDRSIVTPQPGTTRDSLDAQVEWRGLPLLLHDTAGLRDTEDPIEREGVRRIRPLLEGCDLILHLVPAGDAAEDPFVRDLLAPFKGRSQVIRTFGDLAPGPGPWEGEPRICAPSGDLDGLEGVLRSRFLGPLSPEACRGALGTPRQRELLTELLRQVRDLRSLDPGAPAELMASGLQGLWTLLTRLSGEDRAESTLDQVFGGFCLGK
ncbi:MAG: tRNA modification GTPase [Acidobacteria bacterium]|nr:tRNA modification GTPase [Acidobacteriota bacterium]